jgi:catechol 2,3-dioxygenase-like lactoylglutathione lyase family enzyme
MENQFMPLTFPETNTNSKFSSIKAGHIAIRTTEYGKTIKWYIEKLDFRLIREWVNGEMQLAFIASPNDNNFLIEILGSKNVEQTGTGTILGYHHLCFNVENLDKTIEELNNREIKITRSFSIPAIGKRVAFINDISGNAIEFCEDIK